MRRSITITFVVTEIALYIVFMTMDLLGYSGSTIVLKYSGILLCVLFSVLCAYHGREKLIPWALLFTAVADYFLLVIDRYYTLGILFFIIVQSIYLYDLWKKAGRIWIPIRIACLVLAVAVLSMTGLFSAQNLAAGIYYPMILVNMVMSWTYRGKMRILFALGITLFVLCDTCVGLYNLYWILPDGLYEFTRIGMWMFYLPSQVLISLSMLKQKEKR